MSNLLMINKHGSNIPVYDINNDSRQIGYLNNREAFVMYSTNGSNRLYIYFLDGSGNFTKGVIKEDSDYNLSFYTEYPIKKDLIEQNPYLFFKMRKSMPVYYSDGRRWGTVAANCYVATDRNRWAFVYLMALFIIALVSQFSSVYKELHADRETGAADNK